MKASPYKERGGGKPSEIPDCLDRGGNLRFPSTGLESINTMAGVGPGAFSDALI